MTRCWCYSPDLLVTNEQGAADQALVWDLHSANHTPPGLVLSSVELSVAVTCSWIAQEPSAVSLMPATEASIHLNLQLQDAAVQQLLFMTMTSEAPRARCSHTLRCIIEAC